MCTGIIGWKSNFGFPLMISDGFVWDANRMVAELRLLRALDFERYKKVRNPLQKSENSEHFGGPEETRTLDLSDANRTLSQLSYRPIFMNFLRVNRVAPA